MADVRTGRLVIALAQLRVRPTIEENTASAVALIEEASRRGAALIAFPELQFTPFFPQHAGRDASAFAMGIDHPAILTLREKAREHSMVVMPNLYLATDTGRYDATLVIDANGELLGGSEMVHIAQLPCFYEADYYTPSPGGFRVYDTAIGRVGVVVCFDRHYPESTRACALAGASLVIVPTANVVSEPLDLFEWEMRVAAVQNGLFVATCNRVGREDAAEFCGESLVAGPDGGLLAKAGADEELLVTEVNLDAIDAARRARPYLALRREDACSLGRPPGRT